VLEWARVARALRIPAIALALLAALLSGCGGSGNKASTATVAAKAACTKPALLHALQAAAPGSASSVQTLRCAPAYALTRVRQGKTRAVVLWHDASGVWVESARDVPGACPAQAAARSLCKAPPPDPALRRCTDRAFATALRDDVDDPHPIRVESRRCTAGFARTRFVINACKPGFRGERFSCERVRIAAWRLGPDRWRLILYRPKLDCTETQAAAPGFPSALCI
jgi:hypothetical protein